jgi:transmembrane sensor
VEQEATPGSAKAILTLGTGKKLTLDAKASETLSELGIRNNANVIEYSDAAHTEMNTLTTPRGGQYQIILSDGTKVWLNAASSITYPTVFTGKRRQLSITGEVYFEVATNKEKPFEVSIDNASVIEVLGTHFNVNAYNDEPVATTTLLEGSIKIDRTIMKPGESYSNGQITQADISSVMAWKNGYFQLKGASTEELMRQFSRWYDVDVSFEGPIEERKFAGQLQRSLKLTEALRILEESNIHFRREGKKLIVVNK